MIDKSNPTDLQLKHVEKNKTGKTGLQAQCSKTPTSRHLQMPTKAKKTGKVGIRRYLPKWAKQTGLVSKGGHISVSEDTHQSGQNKQAWYPKVPLSCYPKIPTEADKGKITDRAGQATEP